MFYAKVLFFLFQPRKQNFLKCLWNNFVFLLLVFCWTPDPGRLDWFPWAHSGGEASGQTGFISCNVTLNLFNNTKSHLHLNQNVPYCDIIYMQFMWIFVNTNQVAALFLKFPFYFLWRKKFRRQLLCDYFYFLLLFFFFFFSVQFKSLARYV